MIIAKLGGYLNRKCDVHPGFECLAKGYVKFEAILRGFTLMKSYSAKLNDHKRYRKDSG